MSDNVGDHALANPDSLASERWLGTDDEEIEAYVTELCYIHSKLLIVDDRRVICGSANLNDRCAKVFSRSRNFIPADLYSSDPCAGIATLRLRS